MLLAEDLTQRLANTAARELKGREGDGAVDYTYHCAQYERFFYDASLSGIVEVDGRCQRQAAVSPQAPQGHCEGRKDTRRTLSILLTEEGPRGDI